jgi:hypothetical protein
VAEWLRSGLQSRVRRFDSGRGLHQIYPYLAGFWPGVANMRRKAWNLLKNACESPPRVNHHVKIGR